MAQRSVDERTNCTTWSFFAEVVRNETDDLEAVGGRSGGFSYLIAVILGATMDNRGEKTATHLTAAYQYRKGGPNDSSPPPFPQQALAADVHRRYCRIGCHNYKWLDADDPSSGELTRDDGATV